MYFHFNFCFVCTWHFLFRCGNTLFQILVDSVLQRVGLKRPWCVSLYIDWSSSVCPVLGLEAAFPDEANGQFHVDNSLLV